MAKLKKLNRNSGQRKALFKSLIGSLFVHEEIKTTEGKAKAIRSLVDKLIAKAKVNSLHVRRQLLSFLPNNNTISKLMNDIAPRFKAKQSGFTRLIKLGKRKGDNAMVVKMELTEKKAKISKAAKLPKDKKVSPLAKAIADREAKEE